MRLTFKSVNFEKNRSVAPQHHAQGHPRAGTATLGAVRGAYTGNHTSEQSRWNGACLGVGGGKGREESLGVQVTALP